MKLSLFNLQDARTIQLIVAEVDDAAAREISAGRLHKADVLAVLQLLRAGFEKRDPELAARLIPVACEAAKVGQAEHPTHNIQGPTSNGGSAR